VPPTRWGEVGGFIDNTGVETHVIDFRCRQQQFHRIFTEKTSLCFDLDRHLVFQSSRLCLCAGKFMKR
jgi:hypothetical protein